jgi:hypothetical protein
MTKITYLCLAFLLGISVGGHAEVWSQQSNTAAATSQIQRVRIDFVNPTGYTRHLLLAFTPDDAATDGVDYGYDALNIDNYPDDLNWMIEGGRYVIQGVGAFNDSKFYPFGMFLSNSGTIKISLNALENFDTPINVFIYDSLLDTFTSINDFNYNNSLTKGDYINRFYIAFSNNSIIVNTLSLTNTTIKQTTLYYQNSSKELVVKTNSALTIKEISVYNILGKKLLNMQNVNSNAINIPVSGIRTSSSLILNITTSDGKQLNKHILTNK